MQPACAAAPNKTMPINAGLCPVCNKNKMHSNSAKRCGECYRARRGIKSVAKPRGTCPHCGKSTFKHSKQCLDCWYKRVGTKTKKQSLERQTIRHPLTSYDEAYKAWGELIGMSKDRYTGPPDRTGVENVTRICVIPDLHVPHHVPELLAALIARESDRTDLAVMIGDVSDCYSVSRFTQYEKVPFEFEFSQLTATLQIISQAFPSVSIVAGNHDKRVSRQIAAHLPNADWVDAVRAMTGGVLDPIYAVTKSLPNVEIVKHAIPDCDLTVDWLTVIGDAIFAHPEVYSRVPGAAARKLDEFCHDHGEAMGIDYAALRFLCMGHTHTMSLLPWRSSTTKLMVECGCLCKTAGYMTQPRIGGGRPQRRGYVTLTQYDGRTDLNSVRLHFLDLED